jgi:hypothetical protein
MPTSFKHAVIKDVGIVPIDVVQIPEGVRATVIGCNIANTTDYDTVSVTVYVVSEDSVQAVYIKGLTIGPNSSVKLITNGEKLILPETAGLRIESDKNNSIDVVVSYVEIS